MELLKKESRTLIFYEAPHRIEDCLKDMVDIFGENRRLGFARELTKTFETIVVNSAKNIAEFVGNDGNQRKGEMVIIVQGVVEKKEAVLDTEVERIVKLLLDQLPPKQATALAADITGVDKKILYNWAIDNKK